MIYDIIQYSMIYNAFIFCRRIVKKRRRKKKHTPVSQRLCDENVNRAKVHQCAVTFYFSF